MRGANGCWVVGLVLGLAACGGGSGGEEADDGAADLPAEADAETSGEDAAADDAAPDGTAPDDGGGDVPADDGGGDVPADDGGGDAPDDGGADEGGTGNACADRGGICTGSGVCPGAVDPLGAPGCLFDDGPGECCLPPDPEPTGDDCAAYGGVCAPIGGCDFVAGWFTPADCAMGPSYVCCVPEERCGQHDRICCAPGPSADFRPVCDRTGLTCPFAGTILRPLADCPG